jgi:hypothetical protein
MLKAFMLGPKHAGTKNPQKTVQVHTQIAVFAVADLMPLQLCRRLTVSALLLAGRILHCKIINQPRFAYAGCGQ